MSRWVLLELPGGIEYAVQAWRNDTERQLRGVALVKGSTVTPLIAATDARREALQYAANLLGDFAEGPEDAKHLAVLDEMLREMSGGSDGAATQLQT